MVWKKEHFDYIQFDCIQQVCLCRNGSSDEK